MDKTSAIKDYVGCALQQDPENFHAITLMMEWRSQEAFREYQQSEHLGVLLGVLHLLCVPKKMQFETLGRAAPGVDRHILAGLIPGESESLERSD